MTQVMDVTKSMNSAITMFYPIALMNRDPLLRSVYFDPENGTALVGFRRQVANFGVMLVRAQYGRHNEVKIGDYYRKLPGLYNYAQESEYIETHAGLAGSEEADGAREAVHHAAAEETIKSVKEVAELGFEVQLNPRVINEFFEKNKTYFERKEKNYENMKVNLQFTAGLPRGTFTGTAELAPGGDGVVLFAKVPSINGGIKMIPVHIARNSVVPANKVIPGQVYILQTVPKTKEDKEAGVYPVSVLGTYKQGIRLAVQHFNMGTIRPGDRAYSVHPENSNGITTRSILNMQFFPGANLKKVKGAPMITVDADMFRALMKTMQRYNVVTLKFRDATSGLYFRAEGNDIYPTIEAVLSPTIQYVRGRIWLP